MMVCWFMTIVTRFAPSPTGYLHMGNMRTALFNWMYARHKGGRFLLRIEDTDRVRSTEAAIGIILDSLNWMGLEWDGDVVYQSQQQVRHVEVARQLVESGKAYYCYMSQEEAERSKNSNRERKVRSPWRDSASAPVIPAGLKPVVRLKVDTEGVTTVNDAIKGSTAIENLQLDDMVILRSDGTPTYMMAAVIDDHDMGVNYVIRGEDHFTNTFRQAQLYKALGWPLPCYAHLPLIKNQGGTKLSKRCGAKSIIDYKNEGYLPEAMCNYLLLLGWGHDEHDIWTKEEAAMLFDVADVGKAAACFDQKKLDFINAHYIQRMADDDLFARLVDYWDFGHMPERVCELLEERVRLMIPLLKMRAKTLASMVQVARLCINKESPVDARSAAVLRDRADVVSAIYDALSVVPESTWRHGSLKEACEDIARQVGISAAVMMQVLRAAVIGTFDSPGVYDFMFAIGRQDVLCRLAECVNRDV